MEQYFLPVILILVGALVLVRNITHFLDDEKLRIYLETSPKSKMWVKKFGVEKTMSLSKTIFLPIGSIVAFVLLGVGLWNTAVLMQLL